MLSELEMWSYRKDEYYSPEEVIKTYYQDLLKENEELARAVAQAETAKRAINQIMEELNV